MSGSADTKDRPEKYRASSLIRDVADMNLKRLRTRLANSVAADLRGLFFRGDMECKDGEESDPKA